MRMAAGDPLNLNQVRSGADAVAFLNMGGGTQPDGLFVATLRLFEAINGSDFKSILSGPFCEWVARGWSRVVERQAFILRDPRANGPAILAAIKASTGDLPSAARIALAALPSVRISLSPQVRQELEGCIAPPSTS